MNYNSVNIMDRNSSLAPLSYSVVIRTLGNSGDKYEALLRSLSKQSIQPEEIIVAIPQGYELDRMMGNETVFRATKGMVSQRAEAISVAKSKYILVCDDDIEFNECFVENLYKYLIDNELDCVLPMEGGGRRRWSSHNGTSLFISAKAKMCFYWSNVPDSSIIIIS